MSTRLNTPLSPVPKRRKNHSLVEDDSFLQDQDQEETTAVTNSADSPFVDDESCSMYGCLPGDVRAPKMEIIRGGRRIKKWKECTIYMKSIDVKSSVFAEGSAVVFIDILSKVLGFRYHDVYTGLHWSDLGAGYHPENGRYCGDQVNLFWNAQRTGARSHPGCCLGRDVVRNVVVYLRGSAKSVKNLSTSERLDIELNELAAAQQRHAESDHTVVLSSDWNKTLADMFAWYSCSHCFKWILPRIDSPIPVKAVQKMDDWLYTFVARAICSSDRSMTVVLQSLPKCRIHFGAFGGPTINAFDDDPVPVVTATVSNRSSQPRKSISKPTVPKWFTPKPKEQGSRSPVVKSSPRLPASCTISNNSPLFVNSKRERKDPEVEQMMIATEIVEPNDNGCVKTMIGLQDVDGSRKGIVYVKLEDEDEKDSADNEKNGLEEKGSDWSNEELAVMDIKRKKFEENFNLLHKTIASLLHQSYTCSRNQSFVMLNVEKMQELKKFSDQVKNEVVKNYDEYSDQITTTIKRVVSQASPELPATPSRT